MNREIEFRGLYKGEFVYGNLIQGVMEAETFCQIENTDPEEFRQWEVDPKTVGQYSGHKDKNGEKIYEGDIYHQGDKSITYTVVWHDSGLIGKQNGSSSYAGIKHWRNRIEVIGNIHQPQP